MNKGFVFLWIIGFMFLVIIDVSLVISLLKQGDERRQLIVWETSTYTFSVLVGMMLLDCLARLLSSLLNIGDKLVTNSEIPFS